MRLIQYVHIHIYLHIHLNVREGDDGHEGTELLLMPDAHLCVDRVKHRRADEGAVLLLAQLVDAPVQKRSKTERECISYGRICVT